MPNFTNHWDEPDRDFPFHLKRTPAAGTLTAIVTSTDVLSTKTHFTNNRTIPCELPEQCDPCEQGVSWRRHVYVTAIDPKTSEHFIFETTPTAADTFKNYMNYHEEIRGCLFKAARPSNRANGRIVIQCKRLDLATQRLPEPPNLERLLCHIWNVPYKDAKYDHRTVRQHLATVGRPLDGNGDRAA